MYRILIIFLCFFSLSVSAQKYKAGLFTGLNFSFLSVNSDFSYFWTDQYQPGFGFEIGAIGSLKLADQFYFDHSLSYNYVIHRDTKEIHFKEMGVDSIYKSNKYIINNRYFTMSPMISYFFIESMYIGTGINMNLLINSYSDFKDNSEVSRLTNTFYNTINFGIPVLIGYYKEGYFFRLKMDFGISNLMKDSNSFFSEKENTLSLTFGYFFR